MPRAGASHEVFRNRSFLSLMLSLGINYSQMHDSAAGLVRDGEVVFAIAEERLSRVKHDAAFPRRAIQACLTFGAICAGDLDFICYGWSPAGDVFRHDLACYLRGSVPASGLNLLNSSRHFLSMWRQNNGQKRFEQYFGKTRARILFVEHHLAHAISTYALSGFDEAAMLVIDGRGAWEATSFWRGLNGRIEHLETIPWPNSLGMFYAEFTQFQGFQKYSDEWKMMGLAPYGRPGVDLNDFIHLGERDYRVNSRLLLGDGSAGSVGIARKLGAPREPESELKEADRDLAFAVQDTCERAMIGLASRAVDMGGSRNLCLAGGVALNSKANGRILVSGLCQGLFIPPAAGDEGVAIGAALAPMLEGNCPLPLNSMRQAYLGTEVSEEDVETALRTFQLRHESLEDPATTAAELLAEGKIIGWFQGRMEFGPRALGNRSILADPRNAAMKDRVNDAVKFRESWRPFAPSLLAESAPEYLESAHDSPFMAMTAQVRSGKRGVIPVVTHVDGSTRPQTVESNANPLYWRLIDEFRQRTGVPVVMNTSFNLRGEPIVSTPADAIRTFFSSGMDALIIGRFLLHK
jgi:carbamoyltransferase